MHSSLKKSLTMICAFTLINGSIGLPLAYSNDIESIQNILRELDKDGKSSRPAAEAQIKEFKSEAGKYRSALDSMFKKYSGQLEQALIEAGKEDIDLDLESGEIVARIQAESKLFSGIAQFSHEVSTPAGSRSTNVDRKRILEGLAELDPSSGEHSSKANFYSKVSKDSREWAIKRLDEFTKVAEERYRTVMESKPIQNRLAAIRKAIEEAKPLDASLISDEHKNLVQSHVQEYHDISSIMVNCDPDKLEEKVKKYVTDPVAKLQKAFDEAKKLEDGAEKNKKLAEVKDDLERRAQASRHLKELAKRCYDTIKAVAAVKFDSIADTPFKKHKSDLSQTVEHLRNLEVRFEKDDNKKQDKAQAGR